jgi:integrase/recombinase XerD
LKVQKVILPDSGKIHYTLMGDDFLPVEPVMEYLNHLMIKNQSPNTTKSYCTHLKLFWEFLKDYELDWKTVDLNELSEFIHWLQYGKRQNIVHLVAPRAQRVGKTVNTIVGVVCRFYDYQSKLGNVRELPLYKHVRRRTGGIAPFLAHLGQKPTKVKELHVQEEETNKHILTKEEVEKIIAACNTARDMFLICLLYETGMRIGQALGLRHEDIKSMDNVIRIIPRNDNANGARGKSKHRYQVDVPVELMQLYVEYLDECGDYDSDYVFINLNRGKLGEPMTVLAVNSLFGSLRKRTGIYVTPHMFRHTHATETILDKNITNSLIVAQRRLGHKTIGTTLDTYGHITPAYIREEYTEGMINRRKR